MPFKGIVQKNIAYTTEITPAVANLDSTAVCYTNINNSDKIQNIDVQTIPTTTPVATLNHTMGAAIVRLQIAISPPSGGLAQFRLIQGTTIITHDVIGDCVLTFDVVV